jgi:hypothetical protein
MIVFLLFSFSYSFNILQIVEGQMNMDSFTARGVINIPISQIPLLNDQHINDTRQISDLLINSNNIMESNTSNSLPIIQGQWAMAVNKGEIKFFRVLFTIIQNDKIVNAIGLYNLTDTKYVQLNDKGTEIITGNIDFTSVGLKNETIFNVPATISITSLTQLRIALDETIIKPYFTDPIIGVTRQLTDANGNIIVGPRPQPNTPQSNSLYESNIF